MIGTARRSEQASEAGGLTNVNGRGVGQTDRQTDRQTYTRSLDGLQTDGERSIAIGNIMELTPQSPIISMRGWSGRTATPLVERRGRERSRRERKCLKKFALRRKPLPIRALAQ